MAADTQRTLNVWKENSLYPDEYKIKQYQNGILVGAVGTVSSIMQLYLHDEWFDLKKDEPLTHEFIVKKIVNPLYDELKKIDNITKTWRNVMDLSSNFLIVKEDKIFQISNNGSVIEIPLFSAIGCGYQIVSPYFTYVDEKDIHKKLMTSLDLSSHYNTGISRPYIMINSKDLTYEIIK